MSLDVRLIPGPNTFDGAAVTCSPPRPKSVLTHPIALVVLDGLIIQTDGQTSPDELVAGFRVLADKVEAARQRLFGAGAADTEPDQ